MLFIVPSPPEEPPSSDHRPPEPPIKEVRILTGDAFFVQLPPEAPDIPEGKGRPCPQCGRTAWALSRWCWHCKFDFDRAAIPRFHPVKIAFCALIALASSLATVLALRPPA